jgi:hypothetical protein
MGRSLVQGASAWGRDAECRDKKVSELCQKCRATHTIFLTRCRFQSVVRRWLCRIGERQGAQILLAGNLDWGCGGFVVLWGRVGDEPSFLLFHELGGLFAEVADGLQGEPA